MENKSLSLKYLIATVLMSHLMWAPDAPVGPGIWGGCFDRGDLEPERGGLKKDGGSFLWIKGTWGGAILVEHFDFEEYRLLIHLSTKNRTHSHYFNINAIPMGRSNIFLFCFISKFREWFPKPGCWFVTLATIFWKTGKEICRKGEEGGIGV